MVNEFKKTNFMNLKKQIHELYFTSEFINININFDFQL